MFVKTSLGLFDKFDKWNIFRPESILLIKFSNQNIVCIFGPPLGLKFLHDSNIFCVTICAQKPLSRHWGQEWIGAGLPPSLRCNPTLSPCSLFFNSIYAFGVVFPHDSVSVRLCHDASLQKIWHSFSGLLQLGKNIPCLLPSAICSTGKNMVYLTHQNSRFGATCLYRANNGWFPRTDKQTDKLLDTSSRERESQRNRKEIEKERGRRDKRKRQTERERGERKRNSENTTLVTSTLTAYLTHMQP